MADAAMKASIAAVIEVCEDIVATKPPEELDSREARLGRKDRNFGSKSEAAVRRQGALLEGKVDVFEAPGGRGQVARIRRKASVAIGIILSRKVKRLQPGRFSFTRPMEIGLLAGHGEKKRNANWQFFLGFAVMIHTARPPGHVRSHGVARSGQSGERGLIR